MVPSPELDRSDNRTDERTAVETERSPTLSEALPDRAFPAVEGARSPFDCAPGMPEDGADAAHVERWRLTRAARARVVYIRAHDRQAVQAEYIGEKDPDAIPLRTTSSDGSSDEPPCRVVTAELPEDDIVIENGNVATTVAHAEKMTAAIKALASYIEFLTPDDVDIKWEPRRPAPDLVITPISE
jgi:hypothetical protein